MPSQNPPTYKIATSNTDSKSLNSPQQNLHTPLLNLINSLTPLLIPQQTRHITQHTKRDITARLGPLQAILQPTGMLSDVASLLRDEKGSEGVDEVEERGVEVLLRAIEAL